MLTATLDGQSIGGSFVFDPATNDAIFTPTTRWSEGAHAFTAFVTDSSGRRSRTITAQFTVDTLAPRFVNVSPADGSNFTSPNITLQGNIDDASGRVGLESFGAATISGANPQGQFFSWGIGLAPGTNSFRLTATDPAGNATPLSLAYSFSTLTLTIASPANGATIDDNKVTVTGTFSGAATATVTVNGIAAVVSGNAFTAADIPLHAGSNTLTVVGTSPQGATDTKVITVISSAPSITLTTPANGAALGGDNVLVSGQIQAPANSGVTVNGIVAIVDAGGNYFANAVPLLPGSNTLTATVTTPGGKSVSASVMVTSAGPSPVVITADPPQGTVPLRVGFKFQNPAGLALTSFSFNPGGAGSQVAPGPGEFFAFTYSQPGITSRRS